MPLSIKTLHENQPAALVIGAMNLDVLAIASQLAIPEDSTPGKVTSSAGGVGRNIAEGLSRLGIDTSLISAVGDDDAGRQLLMHCKSAGIDTSLITSSGDHNTSSYVSMHSADGSLLYAISDMFLMDRFTAEHIEELPQHISQADLCVIDSNLPESLISTVAKNSGQTALVADAVSVTKCQRLRSVLPKLSLLKVNRHEAEALTGCKANGPLSVLLDRTLALGPGSVLLTLGKNGAQLGTYREGSLQVFNSVAPKAEVKSVNGAGDALMAGYLAAALYGHDTPEKMRWGTVAAGLSLQTRKACSTHLSTDSMR